MMIQILTERGDKQTMKAEISAQAQTVLDILAAKALSPHRRLRSAFWKV